MHSDVVFIALATLMCGVAAACVVAALGRGAGLALRVAFAAGLAIASAALYAELGDFAALGGTRAALSVQLRDAVAGTDAPAPSDAAYIELEGHLRRQPDDARALVLKARIDMQAQRFEAAATAYRTALNGASKATRDAGLWLEFAEAVGLAQGGTLLGQPALLVDKALSLDPNDPKALDLAGSAAWERGDFASAVLHWQRLLQQVAPRSQRHTDLTAAIGRAALRAQRPPR